MSTNVAELLKLSIIYRTLIDNIEAIAGVSFSATEKHRMIQVVSDAMGEAVCAYVARCENCDRGIQLICTECEEETTR